MHPIVQDDTRKLLAQVDLEGLRDSRVLLTGANGFLGSAIARAIFLLNQEQKLRCRLDALSLHGPSLEMKGLLGDSRIRFSKANLSNRSFRVLGNYDYVFHAAGYGQPAKFSRDPKATVALNVNATETLLEAVSRSGGKLIFFSSCTVYGDAPRAEWPVTERYPGRPDTQVGPHAVYVEAKRLGEAICAAAGLLEARSVIVRIAHTYGPGISIRDDRALGHFLRMALTEGRIRLRDAGRAVKTFGYVSDVVGMILYAAVHGRDHVYNVGGRDTISIRQLAEAVGRVCRVPVTASSPKGRRVECPAIIDCTKVWREMGKPKLIALGDGVARTVAWNRDVFCIPSR